jgi:hypothetical protein
VFVAVGSKIIVCVEVGTEVIATAVGIESMVCAGVQDARRRMKNCVITTKQTLFMRGDCFVVALRATPRNDILYPAAFLQNGSDFLFEFIGFLL